MPTLEPPEPLLVLAPHLDDAVLSCGQLLHDSSSPIVVTVMAGAPPVPHEGYNSKTTGKTNAPEAIALRRDEDRSAMDYLGATPIWLDLYEADYTAFRPASGYGETVRNEIARTISETESKSIFAPLGLMHADHLVVSDACLELVVDTTFTWYLYMDLPYGLADRGAMVRRVAALNKRVRLEEFDLYVGDPEVKRRAMSFYASQYGPTRRSFRRAFDATIRGGERYWRVETNH
jgi:LmbE family N-acetylglucosaminyl deacetylase